MRAYVDGKDDEKGYLVKGWGYNQGRGQQQIWTLHLLGCDFIFPIHFLIKAPFGGLFWGF